MAAPACMYSPIGERAACARGGLDQHLVARLAQRRHAAGHQAYARFMIFDFFRNADDHRECSSITWRLRAG